MQKSIAFMILGVVWGARKSQWMQTTGELAFLLIAILVVSLPLGCMSGLVGGPTGSYDPWYENCMVASGTNIPKEAVDTTTDGGILVGCYSANTPFLYIEVPVVVHPSPDTIVAVRDSTISNTGFGTLNFEPGGRLNITGGRHDIRYCFIYTYKHRLTGEGRIEVGSVLTAEPPHTFLGSGRGGWGSHSRSVLSVYQMGYWGETLLYGIDNVSLHVSKLDTATGSRGPIFIYGIKYISIRPQ